MSLERADGQSATDNPHNDGGLFIPDVWADRLREASANGAARPTFIPVVRKSPTYYAGRITSIIDGGGARVLTEFARQRALSHIGFDFEFNYSRPGVSMGRRKGKDRFWHDPRSVVPLLLAITLAEPDGAGGFKLYRSVVDCRRPEIVAPLAALFRVAVPFVAHFAQAELFCLWQLGLPVPDQIWDTWTAERAFRLGVHHARYVGLVGDKADEAAAKEESEDATETSCALIAVCNRRAVPHAFALDKNRLQKSFLDHGPGVAFIDEQIDYAAADADAVIRLYPPQVEEATANGTLSHLITVEMPWTVTNARIIWDGVRVDPGRCEKLRVACVRHSERLSRELAADGLDNVNSPPQVFDYFSRLGLLGAFRTGSKHSFDDKHLEAVEECYPAARRVRLLRRMTRMMTDKSLTGELVGADSRLHPDHRQLGAESGRNTMRWPNIGGIGRMLRPIVVPDDGYGLGEVDLSQIEVGIAAAWYSDQALIEMFNCRDVYTAMARVYYASELPPEATVLKDADFKRRFGSLRDRMKVFTLATVYNITPYGLGLRLGISTAAAEREQTKFLVMFPALAGALKEAAAFGVLRGFADTVSGLRRWRAKSGLASQWEANWMRNTPVQGSAAVVFKVAGNRLLRRYQYYSARLVLPMHDAFVFEAPLDKLEEVARVTQEVMVSAVQEYFPALDPQAEVNIEDPTCWNKDGHSDSLDRWIDDPEAVLGPAKSAARGADADGPVTPRSQAMALAVT
jgi:DNA polymerase-1